MKEKRLGDAELEIMQVLWQGGSPLTAQQVREGLEGRRPWALSTLMTALSRLGEKGFVSCDKAGKNNLYRPLISEEDYRAGAGKRFLRQLYGSSVRSMVASLYDGKVIGERDLSELRQLLDELEREGRERS